MSTSIRSFLSFIWYALIGLPFRLLPIDHNLIVAQSFFGSGYSDNVKYICDAIYEAHNDADIVLLVKVKSTYLPDYIRQVERGTLQELKCLAQAALWIDNSRKPVGLKKRRSQKYLQTWHGGIALKHVELDCATTLSSRYVKCAKNDSKMADWMISGSCWQTDLIRHSFWFEGEILEYGLPRTDPLVNASLEAVTSARRKLNLNDNMHLILYVPTFRDDGDRTHYFTRFNELIDVIERTRGGQWCAYVKLHPNDKGGTAKFATERLVLCDNSQDINDLILAADIVITDYSSCMFDAALAGKDVILYCSDLCSYQDDRGLYFDMNQLPFAISLNDVELFEIFKSGHWSNRSDVEKFFIDLGMYETGFAANTIADVIWNGSLCGQK